MRSPLYGESQRKEVGDEHVCPRPIGKVTRPVLSPEYDKSPSSLLVPLRPRFVIIVIVIVVIVIVSVVIGIVVIIVIVIVIVIVVIVIIIATARTMPTDANTLRARAGHVARRGRGTTKGTCGT